MDPISIASGTLGAAFLGEGVKFLWSEAAKILERYHKRAEAERERTIELTDAAPAELQLPATRQADVARVREHIGDLERLTKELALYGVGARPIDAGDAELVTSAEELRALLAKIYAHPSLPSIQSRVAVGTVESGGSVTGVRGSSDVRVESVVQADEVRGEVTGVDLTKG
jgi:hypothetical protein